MQIGRMITKNGLLVAGFATPAFAAEFFVAQNNTTHKCSIVSKKPDSKRLTQLGTESFKTKSAAETALKPPDTNARR